MVCGDLNDTIAAVPNHSRELVVEVVVGSAQDRLVIERDRGTFEVPFVDDLVPVVDVDGGFVEIVELPGLTEPSD